MKSELTKQITEKLHTYSPDKLSGLTLNKFRKSFGCDEVLVFNSDITGGIVDYMRFNEYRVSDGYYKGCKVCNKHYAHVFRLNSNSERLCKREFTDWKQASFVECSENCPYCCNIEKINYKPLITCFEIKVTKDDFGSSHGHNFVGHLNYYVMPNTLYNQVKQAISPDVGVITYNGNSLRQVKQSVYKELTDAELFERVLCLTKALLR